MGFKGARKTTYAPGCTSDSSSNTSPTRTSFIGGDNANDLESSFDALGKKSVIAELDDKFKNQEWKYTFSMDEAEEVEQDGQRRATLIAPLECLNLTDDAACDLIKNPQQNRRLSNGSSLCAMYESMPSGSSFGKSSSYIKSLIEEDDTGSPVKSAESSARSGICDESSALSESRLPTMPDFYCDESSAMSPPMVPTSPGVAATSPEKTTMSPGLLALSPATPARSSASGNCTGMAPPLQKSSSACSPTDVHDISTPRPEYLVSKIATPRDPILVGDISTPRTLENSPSRTPEQSISKGSDSGGRDSAVPQQSISRASNSNPASPDRQQVAESESVTPSSTVVSSTVPSTATSQVADSATSSPDREKILLRLKNEQLEREMAELKARVSSLEIRSSTFSHPEPQRHAGEHQNCSVMQLSDFLGAPVPHLDNLLGKNAAKTRKTKLESMVEDLSAENTKLSARLSK